MISRSDVHLSATQKRVLEAFYEIWERTQQPVPTQDLIVETLLSPDQVVRSLMVLAAAGLVRVHDPEKDGAELQLEVAGAAR